MNYLMSVRRPEWEEMKPPKKVEIYLSKQGQDEERVMVNGMAEPGVHMVVENLRVRVRK